MIDITRVPLVLALLGTMLTAMIVAFFVVMFRVRKAPDYTAQLAALTEGFGDSEEKIRHGLWSKWTTLWGKRAREAGMARYSDENNTAGRDALVILLALFALVSLATRNPILGVFAMVFCGVVASVVLKTKGRNKAAGLDAQLPGFISSLKSNLQASETVDNALLKVIPTVQPPLFEAVIPARQKLIAGSSFSEAVREVSLKATSKDLKFLCACMIQAVDSGANMVEQLDAIQRVLVARQAVANEVQKAVKGAMPVLYLTAGILPLLFFWDYTRDLAARSFWFVKPLSYLALAGVLFFYGLGVWLMRREIEKIRAL